MNLWSVGREAGERLDVEWSSVRDQLGQVMKEGVKSREDVREKSRWTERRGGVMNTQSTTDHAGLPEVSDETLARMEARVFEAIDEERVTHSSRSRRHRRAWQAIGIAAAFVVVGAVATPVVLQIGQAGSGGVVVTGGTDGKACIWDLGTMRLRATLEHQVCDNLVFSCSTGLSLTDVITGRNHNSPHPPFTKDTFTGIWVCRRNSQDVGCARGHAD